MQNPFFQSREAVFYNQRLKYYPTPDGGYKLAEICTFSDSVFNPDCFERADFWGSERKKKPCEMLEKENECSLSALNRAKKAAFDYMACNPDCNMFVTLTLDEAKISRTDWAEIVARLNTWLDNCVRRRGLNFSGQFWQKAPRESCVQYSKLEVRIYNRKTNRARRR